MHRTTMRSVLYLLAALASLVAAPPTTMAAAHYDVSYLWHRNVDSVFDYRERVARILGPTVSKDLKVVAKAPLFGLIYDRRGNSARAGKLADAYPAAAFPGPGSGCPGSFPELEIRRCRQKPKGIYYPAQRSQEQVDQR